MSSVCFFCGRKLEVLHLNVDTIICRGYKCKPRDGDYRVVYRRCPNCGSERIGHNDNTYSCQDCGKL
jgi:exosome complex RNA-binding protein Csl4